MPVFMHNMVTFETGQVCIVLLNDDTELLASLKRLLDPLHRPVLATSVVHEAEQYFRQYEVAVLICEPKEPDAAQFLMDCRTRYPNTVRLLLAGYADLNLVLKAANLVNPFKLLIKPWLNEELVETVTTALSQYELEKQRDELIEEYSDIRMNAERSHAFNVLNALLYSIHGDMSATAIQHLPVCALIWKDRAVQLANPAARLALDQAKPDGVQSLPALLEEMAKAPRRQRFQLRLSDTDILAYAVIDLAIGTLMMFTFEPIVGHPLDP